MNKSQQLHSRMLSTNGEEAKTQKLRKRLDSSKNLMDLHRNLLPVHNKLNLILVKRRCQKLHVGLATN
jgi:hypothetical protein